MFQTEIKQAGGKLRLPEMAVESIPEFIEVFLWVFSGHTLEGAQQKTFEIGDSDMHRQPLAGLFPGGDFKTMKLPRRGTPGATQW